MHERRAWLTIAVGYDGSEAAKRALERAAALAGDARPIVVVAVAEPYPSSGVTIPANRDPADIQRRRNELHEVSTKVVRDAACDVLVVR